MTDWELLDQFQRDRDERAFATLVERHLALVYGTARRSLGAGTEAEDVTQAVFVLLSRKSTGISRHGALAGWLYRTTRLCCANVRRKEKRRRAHEMEAAMAHPAVVQAEESGNELRSMLDEAIARLAEGERQAMLVHYWEQKTIAETGVVLGISERAAEKRIERGLARMRKLFGARGRMLTVAALAAALGIEARAGVPAGFGQVVVGVVKTGGSPEAMALAREVAAAMFKARVWAISAMGAVAAGVLALAGYLAARESMPLPGAPVVAVAASAPGTEAALGVPATMPLAAGEHVDVAALVREVREKEQWIETAASFHVKAELTRTLNETEINHRKEELAKQFPGKEITAKEFGELLPLTRESMDLAFDRRRVAAHRIAPPYLNDAHIWDGTRSLRHIEYLNHPQEEFGIGADTRDVAYSFWAISWPHGDRHAFWWDMPETRKENAELRENPEDFELLWRETIRGIDCYVLNLKGRNLLRWHVGVKDHLLHKVDSGTIVLDPEWWKYFAAEAQRRGKVIMSEWEVEDWLGKLPEKEMNEVCDLCYTRINATGKPVFEFWLMDYVEVKPGAWFPMTQATVNYNHLADAHGQPTPDAFQKIWVSGTVDMKIASVEVDKALPEGLFAMEFKEGVSVTDRSHNPPLYYTYKKERTAEEWAAIVAEAEKEKRGDDAVKELRAGLVGKVAPAFPETTWINSKGLTWDDLKGKVVILQFFSEWSGLCRNDLATAVQMDGRREKDGIVIIGIHTPGSSREKIEAMLAENKAAFPVCMDGAGENRSIWGRLFEAYHVDSVPLAVLVDAEEKVAGSGSLSEMAEAAQKLRTLGKK